MPVTTFLHQCELNQSLRDPELQQLLDEARKHTGKDWQVAPLQMPPRKWWQSKREQLYGVYVYIGGIGPWQQINFYADRTHSFGLYVPSEVVAAYLMGMLVRPNKEPK